jgi:addiction module RelE/StbE family toxin
VPTAPWVSKLRKRSTDSPPAQTFGDLLKGEWKGHRKYRTGRYRIIYRIERAQLILYIVTIDDRKDVYR